MQPLGGTELQMQFLERHVDKELLDQIQITTSIPEKIPLSKGKLNILWQHNSYDQPNIAPWFKDKSGPYPIGLAHDCQKVDSLPVEKWDVPLPEIITPSHHYQW